MNDTNFLDLINDPQVREEIKQWLQPTNEIIQQIKEVIEGTALENSVNIVEEKDNKLLLKYYLTSELSNEDRDTLMQREDQLGLIGLPIPVELEVYEPFDCPRLRLSGDNVL